MSGFGDADISTGGGETTVPCTEEDSRQCEKLSTQAQLVVLVPTATMIHSAAPDLAPLPTARPPIHSQ